MKQHTAIDRFWNDAIQHKALNGGNPMRFFFCQMRTYLTAGLFLLATCFGSQLFAQSAAVSGQVVNASGAVVKGATITLLRPSTAVKIMTTSDVSGNFILPPITPGQYEITVTAEGFKPWVDAGITLEIGERKVVNAVLLVGSVSQSVTVSDAPAELQVENADRSTLLEPTFVADLPLDPRNPLQLISATVGVTLSDSMDSGQNSASESRTNSFRINGGKSATTDVLIDGAANTTVYYHQDAGIPGVDATQEFRVLTDAYAPEYGNTSGGIVNISLKSGTNDLHGGAWEYFRNDQLDANGYNANAAGLARPPLTRNQFGAMLGGPIVIPKLFDGHNKTFFFGSYEGLRDTYVTPGGFQATVPTKAERSGDFSADAPIYDPNPANYVSGQRPRFSCNGVNNVICPGRIDSAGQALLNMYPLPTPNYQAGAYNYFSNAPAQDVNNSFDVRIDHQLNDKQSLYGHFDRFSNYLLNANVYGNWQTPNYSNDRIPGYNAMVGHTYTIKNNLIFNHQGSWAHSESNRASTNPIPVSNFGIAASAAPGLTAGFTPQIQAVSGQLSTIANSEPKEQNESSVYQYQAGLTWLRSKHTFKFGTDIRRYPIQLWDPQLMTVAPGRTFTGGPTAGSASTGNSIAELLLGLANVTSGYAPRVNFRNMQYAVYAEDTYKVTKKLTATFGLRWGYIGAQVANGNALNYLDTTSPSPLAAPSGIPNLVGGVGIPGVNGTSRSLQDPGLLHFEPRLGVAYALDSNTVIHAGFGIFRHPQAQWGTNPNAYGYTRASTSVNVNPDGITPVAGFSVGNPFPLGLRAPYGNNPVAGILGNNAGGGPLSIDAGQSVAGVLPKQSDPYQENWSLDVQRSLPNHFVVTLGYVGNEGVRLMSQVQLNQLPDSVLAQCPAGIVKSCPALNTTVANPFYNVITDPSSFLYKSTVQAGYLLRAFPQYKNFTAANVGWGHSNYEAGQVTVQHRAANGLSMLVGYTYSKAIDDAGENGGSNSIQDIGCHACERSVSDQDETHVLTEDTMYELPFGHDKMFLKTGVPAILAGGWQIGTAYKFNSGQPIGVTSPIQSASLNGGSVSAASGYGTGSAGVMRPTIVPGVSRKTNVPNSKTGENSYFNPLAFTETGTFRFGNAPRYLSDVRLPHYQNLDAFLQKETRLAEHMSVTFRAEMINALNTVVFAGPSVNVSTPSTFGYQSQTQENSPREAQLSARFTF